MRVVEGTLRDRVNASPCLQTHVDVEPLEIGVFALTNETC